MKLYKFIITLFFIVLTTACSKDDILPTPPQPVNIFLVGEYTIVDSEEVSFELQTDGMYILKLVHGQTNQVLSKEKIVGKVGNNKIKIYTNSLPTKIVFFILEDSNKNELGKVKLIIK